MGVIFDIIFETLIYHRTGRWVLVVLIAGLAFWFAGFREPGVWILIGIVGGLALLFEVIDFFFLRKRERK
ncbi:MAG TPA: hypothetical protein PKW21_02805 [Rhabdaerophilum sp.]|nr:hypothetical protein [Rhabdaerophilum sp.]